MLDEYQSLSPRSESREERPTNILKMKPEPLSPRSFFFDKRAKQVSPCSSRDPSPTPLSSTRCGNQRPSPREGRPTASKEKRPAITSASRNFTPTQLNLKLSRQESDTLEALGQQISSTQREVTASTTQTTRSAVHSKQIIDYCKQLSRSESQSEQHSVTTPQQQKPSLLHLHLNLDDSDEEERNPAEISPPRSAKSLPLSARQRSHRNLITGKVDSPNSLSARSVDSTSTPSGPPPASLTALIEYSKTLVRLTSSETIGDITKDRVAYANHALRFAQTTLQSPLATAATSSSDNLSPSAPPLSAEDPFCDESLYSSLMKSQTLLAHYNPTELTESPATVDHSEVKEFQTRGQSKFLPRLKSWSPAATSGSGSPSSSLSQKKPHTRDDGHSSSRSFQRPATATRPHSSSRYLSSSSSSHSFSLSHTSSPYTDSDDSGEGEEGGDDDVWARVGDGEVRVRPRTALVKRYAKESSQRSARDSPEYIQSQLDAMGSDVVYNFEDFLNE
jgi:hypothetical protein